MSSLYLLSKPLFIVLMVVLAFVSALFGRRRYGYSTPAASCCGCLAVAILLPIAILALKMLARMYTAFD